MREIIEEIAENEVSLLDLVQARPGEVIVPVTSDPEWNPKPLTYDQDKHVVVKADRKGRTEVEGSEPVPEK